MVRFILNSVFKLGYWEEKSGKTSLSANFKIKFDFEVSTSTNLKQKYLEHSFIS